MFGGGGAPDGDMVVEQFRKDGAERTQPTMATQASTQEEFLVYRTRRAPRSGRRLDAAAAVAEEESVTSFEAVRAEDVTTLEVSSVEEQTLEVAVAQMEMSVAEQDAMELSLAPASSASMQLSEVDSYVAGAESTYASSARGDDGTAAVRAARDRGRGSGDRRRRNGAACDGGRTGGGGSAAAAARSCGAGSGSAGSGGCGERGGGDA